MNSTDYYRMRQLGLTKATVDPEALEVAFDPKRAYRLLTQYKTIRNALIQAGYNSPQAFLDALRNVDNKKPPEGGTSETRMDEGGDIETKAI